MMQPPLQDEKERCITVTRADDTRRSQWAPAWNRLCHPGQRGRGESGERNMAQNVMRANGEREKGNEKCSIFFLFFFFSFLGFLSYLVEMNLAFIALYRIDGVNDSECFSFERVYFAFEL